MWIESDNVISARFVKHTAVLAFYCYEEILISLLCLFLDRNFDLGGDLNYFTIISLPAASRRMVHGSSVLAFQQEVSELTLGGRRRHRHPRGAAVRGERGAGCAAGVVAEVAQGNPAWEAARKDAQPRELIGRRARLGSSKLSSPAEGDSAQCCTLVAPTKLKSKRCSHFSLHWYRYFWIPLTVENPGVKISMGRAQASWSLSYTYDFKPHVGAPLEGISGSFQFMLLSFSSLLLEE